MGHMTGSSVIDHKTITTGDCRLLEGSQEGLFKDDPGGRKSGFRQATGDSGVWVLAPFWVYSARVVRP